jgi:signal transduction histidine kinase
MAWSPSVISFVILASAALALLVGIGALRKRPNRMAWPLALLMFAVTAWAIAHAISLGFSTVETVVLWNKLRYPGTVFGPVLYFVVALYYAGYDRKLTRGAYAALAVVPLVTIAVVWTNQYHGLFWESVAIAPVGSARVFVPEYGPWYWIDLGYLYLVTALGLGVFAHEMLRSERVYRKQAGMMFVGGLVPLAVNGATTVGIGPEPTVDFTTSALAVTGLTFALALFRLDLLDIGPVARDRLLDQLDDGVVVLGPEGLIREFNPVAERILGDLSPKEPAENVLPANVVSDGGELVAEVDGQERVFRTHSTTLTDERGAEIGRIVYLSDVTQIAKREQRISVLNRVLRHNVRNELTVASGRLELLEDAVASGDREHVDIAAESIEQVVEFADKARYLQQTLQQADAMVETSAGAVTERVLTAVREAHPDATVAYEPPDSADAGAVVRVVDGELFEMALQELIENGIEHHDRETPAVTVTVDRVGDHVQVRVADDGPGIPPEQTEVLGERTETALKHGHGLGLWLVQWMTSLSGGELTFAENEPRGTLVTLTLERATG